MSDHRTPTALLAERYQPESYVGEDYIAGAETVLAAGGWLARPLTDTDRATAARVLDDLHGFGLDVTDVHSFGAVWALRSTGAIAASAAVDDDLTGWRRWEETNHVGEPMTFLPELTSLGIAPKLT